MFRLERVSRSMANAAFTVSAVFKEAVQKATGTSWDQWIARLEETVDPSRFGARSIPPSIARTDVKVSSRANRYQDGQRNGEGRFSRI